VRLVLVLLPPSEGKTAPRSGAPVDLATLSFPQLTQPRRRVLDALVCLARGPRQTARVTLGLSPGLAGEVDRDAALVTAPAARAGSVYSGVLYEALSLPTLDPAARRRAARSLVVVSALWGALRVGDRIPAYRLAMDVELPGIGPLPAAWRPELGDALDGAAGRGVVVDLRSASYAAAWRPGGALAERTVAVRVLREDAGRRTVVSHLAKHHRGQVARHLLVTAARPRTADDVAQALASRWTVELDAPRPGRSRTLDLVVGA
jgi:hypothetical protein